MFGRLWSIDINGDPFIAPTTGPQLRCVFDITVTPGESQSFADVRLYNLSKDSRIPNNARITFRAGYRDAYDVIFVGRVTNSLREREGTEVITRLLCRSGDPYNDRGTANGSYGAGVSVVEVIHDLAKSWPAQLVIDKSQFENDQRMVSGYNTNGDIPSALNELKYAYRFDWVHDRGQLVVTKRNSPRKGQIVHVNQYTGMVGIPEVTLGPNGLGVFVTTRLNPYYRINNRIQVQSEFSTFNTGNLFVQEQSGDSSANGEYNIFAIRYRGDTHGDMWDCEIEALRAGVATTSGTSGTLIWGSAVEQDFRAEVRAVAGRLGFDPNWLMAVMAFETGESFSPSIKHPYGSATGLIQFTSATAIGLGTTTAKLARMNAVEQLHWVEKYFQPYKSRVRNLGDCYMAVLWPRAIGKPDNYVMWRRDDPETARYYNSNPSLDISQDGTITRGEAVTRVNIETVRGQQYAKG
ncbi:MAG: baseplate hub protein [Cetobacterium sp.]|uniref:baseplate hub protein n=1 Tax=Cetobacterium sp. TaxID=2071632 RepID=UPI003EE65144